MCGLSAGVDGFVASDTFKNSPIPLTNMKGAFSQPLAEFVALRVLYHTKHVERFMQRKAEKSREKVKRSASESAIVVQSLEGELDDAE